MGQAAGDRFITKSGYNNGVTTIIDVRSDDADLVYNTAVQSIEVVSADANDDGTPTGTLTLVSAIVGDVAIVNGLDYTGVSGAAAEDEFDIDTSDTLAAASLAAQINADTRTPITVPLVDVTATSAVGVVTINAHSGADGNTVDISSVDSTITASAATLTDVDAAGSWSVKVDGLDANYAEVSETVNLNGTIAVALTQTMIFVESAEIVTGGTDGDNQGVITVRIASAGATQITIAAGESKSSTCNYTVPAGYNAEITSVSYGISNDIIVANSNRLNLFTRAGEDDSQWQLRDTYAPSYIDQTRTYPSGGIELGPKTKVNFKDTRVTGAVENIVHVTYTIVLHQA